MAKDIASLVGKMAKNASNVRYSELCKVCDHYFGAHRQQGTSHRTYKTPWAGDPRVNIQKAKGGKAKSYQVKQVLAAISMLSKQSK